MKNFRSILKVSLLTLVVLMLARVFLYQTVKTDNFHMASTIFPGDRILINKFRAGLRLPISIVGLPGVNAPYADGIRLPYLRLPAFKKLQIQDVVAFNVPAGSDKPIDRKRIMVSRIIGVPSDTVLIQDKIVKVNQKVIPVPQKARAEYRTITDGRAISNEFLRKYDLEKPRIAADIGIFDIDLPTGVNSELEKETGVKTVRETKLFLGDVSIDYYPVSNYFMWNRDQFGTFRVPAKGMTVNLDLKTIDFYRDLIEIHEKHDVIVDFSGVHIDGKIATSYTFEKNYYFVMSDNRDNPDDSRKIGFIPEDHMIGIVTRVIWSHQNKYDYIRKFHIGRFMKRIR